jgi:uncharacterized protein (DUF4415 family)
MSKPFDPEALDQDNPEWKATEIKRAKSFDGLPESLQGKLRGRPRAPVTKERITIRLSPEVVGAFRSTGDGWQTRMDSALKDWLRTHTPD